MTYRLLSVCSGIGGAELSFHGLAEPTGMAEIAPFPRALLAARFPDVPLHDDFTALITDPPAADILAGGTPCFPAGTQVATKRGFLPISDVEVGDEVVTHAGRFRKVVRIGKKIAPLWRIKGQGHPGMTTTEEHPFLSRLRTARDTRVNGKPVRITSWSPEDWTPASKMTGRHWAIPMVWPSLPIPAPYLLGNESICPAVTPELLWLAGAYVGDGWVRISDRRGCLLFGVNPLKAKRICAVLDSMGLSWGITQERTTVRIAVASRSLARWMEDTFGSGAQNKHIPLWLLGSSADYRKAFEDGYATTDGALTGIQPWEKMTASTVSLQLALGLRSLAVTLGYASSIQLCSVPPTKVIEGRLVNQKPFYSVTFSRSNRTSVAMAGFRWQLVRKSAPAGRCGEVFNLEVDEDNSFTADGIVVHNCQAFSHAGLRRSLDDARGNLTLAFALLLDVIDARNARDGRPPASCFWENVPGVLSTKDNAFGCFLGELAGHGAALQPPGGTKWPYAGVVAGPKRKVAWRTLNAQYFGLAQRRRRVFVVASARDGFDPREVLLEREGVQRRHPPSREPGQEVTGTLAARTGAGGGLGTDMDLSGGLVVSVCGDITHTLSAEGADASEDGTGLGTPIVAAYAIQERAVCENPLAGPDGIGVKEGLAYTLEARSVPQAVAVAFGGNRTSGPLDVATTLSAHNSASGRMDFESETFLVQSSPAYTVALRGREGGGSIEMGGEVAGALRASRASQGGGDKPYVVAARRGVRRLTPTECERLQGLPDGWADVPYRGKPAADGPRYKAIGNGWAINVTRWLATRLVGHLQSLEAPEDTLLAELELEALLAAA